MKHQSVQENATELLLSQWQTCVEMADSVSQRRDSMNNLFVSLNLALTATVSIIWDIKSIFCYPLALSFAFFGVFLSAISNN